MTHTFFLMFVRVAGILAMIFAGYLARKKEFLNGESTRALSFLLMNFIYPANIYASLVGNYTLPEILQQWRLPVFEALLLFIGFLVAFPVLLIFRKRSEPERRMFHYQCTLMNFIFMPLPLVMAFMGDKGVALLSLAFVGGETAVWTLGVVAITGGCSLQHVKKIFSVPLASIALSFLTLALVHAFPGLHPTEGSNWALVADTAMSTLKLFGSATVGISMVIAGSRMATLKLSKSFEPFHLTLAACRLVVVPLVCFGVLYLLKLPQDVFTILCLVAMMPCSISSVAYGEVFHADLDTGATAVLLTHVGCLVTVPLFYCLLN